MSARLLVGKDCASRPARAGARHGPRPRPPPGPSGLSKAGGRRRKSLERKSRRSLCLNRSSSTCVVDLWAPGIQAMRLGVAAPHPHSPSTPQEASWAPEAWALRGQGQRQAAGQRLRGAGRGHRKRPLLSQRSGRLNRRGAVGRKAPASKTSSGRKYWNRARIQRKKTGRAWWPGSPGCSGGARWGRGGSGVRGGMEGKVGGEGRPLFPSGR